MEERMIDKEELLGRGAGNAGDGEDEDVYAAYAAGEDGYDEDLVGLTPSQLEEELAHRAQLRAAAHAEAVKLRAEGEEAVRRKAYDEAAELFGQSLASEYDEEVETLFWWARTDGLSSSDVLFDREAAQEFSEAGDLAKKLVLDAFGEELRNARAVLLEEAAPLREQVRAGQEERRAPFVANRRYYRVRFAVFAVLTVLFAAGIGVSAAFLLRTPTNIPTVLMIVFGVLAAVSCGFFLFFSRKLIVASRLCAANEKLASPVAGARLAQPEAALFGLGRGRGEI